MASHGWRSDRPLSLSLRAETGRFDFYQMVRLLLAERGLNVRQLDQGVRFRAHLGQAFPAHEAKVLRDPRGSLGEQLPTAVEMRNYTLAGLLGPLPEALVDQLMARARDGDEVWMAFLDIFNHRLNALRYALKAKARTALDLLPPDQTDTARMYLSLTGLAEPAAVAQLPVPPRAWVGLAGLLVNPRRSATVIARVLRRWIAAPVQVQPLTGSWRGVTPAAWTRLGVQGSSQVLGATARAGKSAWRPSAAVQLTLGPLPYDAYCGFLPGQAQETKPWHNTLCWMVRTLLNWRHDAHVVLLLAEGEEVVEPLSNPTSSEPSARKRAGLRLGQTAWLNGPPRGPRQTSFWVRALRESRA
ncbi:type VI secretion system baseplate subunit TssG [Hylemonella sp. W303a]|uniref:type VI secretion system baseplate subunit TssG n=1 Tax=Hylemonella sp. W303a TaxID=3389873 RepID=UPI00396B0F44